MAERRRHFFGVHFCNSQCHFTFYFERDLEQDQKISSYIWDRCPKYVSEQVNGRKGWPASAPDCFSSARDQTGLLYVTWVHVFTKSVRHIHQIYLSSTTCIYVRLCFHRFLGLNSAGVEENNGWPAGHS